MHQGVRHCLQLSEILKCAFTFTTCELILPHIMDIYYTAKLIIVTVLWLDSDDVVTILSPICGTSGRLQNRVTRWLDFFLIGPRSGQVFSILCIICMADKGFKFLFSFTCKWVKFIFSKKRLPPPPRSQMVHPLARKLKYVSKDGQRTIDTKCKIQSLFVFVKYYLKIVC